MKKGVISSILLILTVLTLMLYQDNIFLSSDETYFPQLDINDDKSTSNGLDIVDLLKYIRGKQGRYDGRIPYINVKKADVDSNGKINLKDLRNLMEELASKGAFEHASKSKDDSKYPDEKNAEEPRYSPGSVCLTPFIRGDIDGNGQVNLVDALYGLDYYFNSGPNTPPCEIAADVDGSDTPVTLLDLIYLLDALFTGGSPIPTPYPNADLYEVCGDGVDNNGMYGADSVNEGCTQPGVTPICDRGRPQIINNRLVADNGAPLRGEHVFMTDLDEYHPNGGMGHGVQALSEAYWRGERDTKNLNTMRLMNYQHPLVIPGYTCGPDQCMTVQEQAAKMDIAIDIAEDLGMYVIVDYHPVGGHDQTAAVAWWNYIAPRYKDRTHVIYEAMNEPVGWSAPAYTSQDIADQAQIYNIIRGHAPETPIILWSFAQTTSGGSSQGMLQVISQAPSISYANAVVGIHPYHGSITNNYMSSSTIQGLVAQYPVLVTEIGIDTPNDAASTQISDVNGRLAYLESQDIGWIMLKSYEEPVASNFQVTWSQDPLAVDQTACLGGTPEICTGGADEDGDGLYDCNDPDCNNDPACQSTAEICTGGVDEDGDGLYDCNDPDCSGDSACQICNANGVCDLTDSCFNCPGDCGSCPIITNGLVLYMPMEDGSGNSVRDTSGNNNDGTLINGPSWVSGQVGTGALDFGGSGAEHVLIPTDPSLESFTSGISLAAWINPSSAPGQSWGRIIHKGSGATSDDYSLTHVGSNTPGDLNKIGLRIRTGAGNVDTISATGLVAPGTGWHHVVGTWDSGSGVMKVYIDGVQQGVTGSTGAQSGPLYDSGLDLHIGSWSNNGARQFNGDIDEVMIFDRALTATEVTDLYNDGL